MDKCAVLLRLVTVERLRVRASTCSFLLFFFSAVHFDVLYLWQKYFKIGYLVRPEIRVFFPKIILDESAVFPGYRTLG